MTAGGIRLAEELRDRRKCRRVAQQLRMPFAWHNDAGKFRMTLLHFSDGGSRKYVGIAAADHEHGHALQRLELWPELRHRPIKNRQAL